MTREELRDLAPIYALGALDGNELKEFEAALVNDGALRSLVAEHREAAAGLSAALAPVKPSNELKTRIMEAVARGREPLALPKAKPNYVWVPFAAAAALFIALFLAKLGEVSLLKEQATVAQGERDRLEASLLTNKQKLAELTSRPKVSAEEVKFMANAQMGKLAGGAGAESALGRVFFQGNEFHVMAAGLPELPTDKDYQLWAVVGEKKLSLGVHRPDADGSLVGIAKLTGEAVGEAVFAVTVEPRGGVDQPTGAMVMVPGK